MLQEINIVQVFVELKGHIVIASWKIMCLFSMLFTVNIT